MDKKATAKFYDAPNLSSLIKKKLNCTKKNKNLKKTKNKDVQNCKPGTVIDDSSICG